jgi:hypothetical protein
MLSIRFHTYLNAGQIALDDCDHILLSINGWSRLSPALSCHYHPDGILIYGQYFVVRALAEEVVLVAACA